MAEKISIITISYNSKNTIVTAVYNGEKYIEECIKSIMNQTYQNFEHIIMDGGSTDNTLEIAKKYEKLYNVKIYSRKDNGMYDAMPAFLNRLQVGF